MIQPILNHAEQSRGDVASIVIERATEKAALEGRYTEEIKNEIYTVLSNIGYREEEIELELTEEQTARGEYVSGTIKVPNKYYFVMFDALFGYADKDIYHKKSATRMSERIIN